MKNKIITIYELMGLIKDGKAPKKIEYDGYIWEYCKNDYDYYSIEKEMILSNEYINILEYLDDIVEILPEENDEWEDIEEINSNADNTLFVMECYTGIPEKAQDWNFNILENEINKLIKNQKYLKEKIDNVKDDVVFDYWKDKVAGKDEN